MIINSTTGDALLLDDMGQIVFFIEMNKESLTEDTIIHYNPDSSLEKIIKFQPILDEITHRPGKYGATEAKERFEKIAGPLA
ncbi:MAG: hypothetical protein Hyperionvirus40_14 [Hyperionvirus sp.]|uniref:Uncharacterized protein n=1 Tax=Hyperionvirus sp. TaxID=2487770 RepID=A0A3G5ACB7_9VIRU|nr:MAG: hypothetical protein Hyperionvirus40_14 [Hyperionvirus sp.]